MKSKDTENIIHNRQRRSFESIINVSFVFIMLAVKNYFSQPHASWIHLIHFVFQPLIIIVSMVDKLYVIQCTLYASIFVLLVDLFIFMLNGVAISRCYNEPTAECFDRLWESSIWIILSLFFSFIDIVNSFQLANLAHQVKQKKDFRINPYENMVINERKMKVLHIYCIPQDIIFVFITILRTKTLPIFWIGITHIFIDPYVIWYGKAESKEIFAFRRILYILMFTINLILFILNLQLPTQDVFDWVSLFILGSYIFIDISLFVLVQETMEMFQFIKKS